MERETTIAQEEKDLLLRELCSRMLYEVHCCVLNLNKTIKEDNDIIYGIVGDNIVTLKSDKNECYMYYQIKPYLRPMSSMTEEEKVQLSQYACIGEDLNGEFIDEVQRKDCAAYIDWLNTHHFDYRRLIEKGLALEAPEDMYKQETT